MTDVTQLSVITCSCSYCDRRLWNIGLFVCSFVSAVSGAQIVTCDVTGSQSDYFIILHVHKWPNYLPPLWNEAIQSNDLPLGSVLFPIRISRQHLISIFYLCLSKEQKSSPWQVAD